MRFIQLRTNSIRRTAQLSVLVACIAALAGCSAPSADSADVVVSIQPQAWFVEQIGAPEIQVDVLVGPGQSPATFDPSARQIAALLAADLFVRAGVPFERALMPKIENLPGRPRIIGAEWMEGAEPAEAHDHSGDDHGHGHDHGSIDPHSWLDPKQALEQVRTINQALGEIHPESRDSFQARTDDLTVRLTALDAELRELLAPHRGRKFFVFHPAFGHFALAYGLEQVSIEADGHEPGARHLADVIEQARAAGAQAIIVQPQFSAETARTVANSVGAGIVALDPLARSYEENLRYLAGQLDELFRSRPVPGSSTEAAR